MMNYVLIIYSITNIGLVKIENHMDRDISMPGAYTLGQESLYWILADLQYQDKTTTRVMMIILVVIFGLLLMTLSYVRNWLIERSKNYDTDTYIVSIQNTDELPSFDYLLDKDYVTHIRANKGRFRLWKAGDVITFVDIVGQRNVRAKIMDIRYYPNLVTCLQTEDVRNLLPGLTSIEEVKAAYNKWYSDELLDKIQRRTGNAIKAFELKILHNMNKKYVNSNLRSGSCEWILGSKSMTSVSFYVSLKQVGEIILGPGKLYKNREEAIESVDKVNIFWVYSVNSNSGLFNDPLYYFDIECIING